MMKNRFLSSALMAGAFALGCFVSQANAAVNINTQDIADFVVDPGSNHPAFNSKSGGVTLQTVSSRDYAIAV